MMIRTSNSVHRNGREGRREKFKIPNHRGHEEAQRFTKKNAWIELGGCELIAECKGSLVALGT